MPIVNGALHHKRTRYNSDSGEFRFVRMKGRKLSISPVFTSETQALN